MIIVIISSSSSSVWAPPISPPRWLQVVLLLFVFINLSWYLEILIY